MLIAESRKVAKITKGASKAGHSTSSPLIRASDPQEAPAAHVLSHGCSVEMIGIPLPAQGTAEAKAHT